MPMQFITDGFSLNKKIDNAVEKIIDSAVIVIWTEKNFSLDSM